MIQLSLRPRKPERLRGQIVRNKKAALTRKYRQGSPIQSKDFDRDYYSHLDIRRPLWVWQDGKCCYCERNRDLKREPDVEHFRPKAQTTGDPGQGYWWLAYEWSNLFFCCKRCNEEFKKNAFPLEEGGIRAQPGNLALGRERPTLVDPAKENPESLIGYLWVIKPEPLAKPVGLDPVGRGDRMIRILGLDKNELNLQRGMLIDTLMGYTEQIKLAIHNNNEIARVRAANRIRRHTSRSQTFAGFRRFFFRQMDLGEYVAD